MSNIENWLNDSIIVRRLSHVVRILLVGTTALLSRQNAFAANPLVTVVNSRAGADYVRARQEDGSFKPETYTFGEGGFTTGRGPDASAEKLTFLDVARTLAAPLARQNYVPGADPKQVDLLIMVYWGTTVGTSNASSSVAYQNLMSSQFMQISNLVPITGPGGTVQRNGGNQLPSASGALLAMVEMENRERDRANLKNAGLLGYNTSALARENFQISALRSKQDDIIDEVQDDRYFVILMAYDFQLLMTQKKHKLVWETRFSVEDRRRNFDEELVAMANSASPFFGQDSHGLRHKQLPTGSTKLDELKVLKILPENGATLENK